MTLKHYLIVQYYVSPIDKLKRIGILVYNTNYLFETSRHIMASHFIF
jgi:hypothetical protein